MWQVLIEVGVIPRIDAMYLGIYLKICLLLTTKSTSNSVYWDHSGKTFNIVKSFLQESLVPVPIICKSLKKIYIQNGNVNDWRIFTFTIVSSARYQEKFYNFIGSEHIFLSSCQP